MDACLFCKIAKKEIPSSLVYEDKDFVAFLDIKPINAGHTLLVPKKHSENLYQMDDDVLKKAGPLLKKIAVAVKKATLADGINIGMNNESCAGQVIMHPHFHIIPRFKTDGLKHWHGKDVSEDEMSAVFEKITKYLAF